MSIIWLCRYICAIFAVLFMMRMLTSYGSGAERFMAFRESITVGGAFTAAILAVVLNRLPTNHRLRQSKPAWIAIVAVTVGVALLMVSFV